MSFRVSYVEIGLLHKSILGSYCYYWPPGVCRYIVSADYFLEFFDGGKGSSRFFFKVDIIHTASMKKKESCPWTESQVMEARKWRNDGLLNASTPSGAGLPIFGHPTYPILCNLISLSSFRYHFTQTLYLQIGRHCVKLTSHVGVLGYVFWCLCNLEKILIYRRKIYLQIYLRLVGLKDPRVETLISSIQVKQYINKCRDNWRGASRRRKERQLDDVEHSSTDIWSDIIQ